MAQMTRRAALAGVGAAALLAGCGNGIGSDGAQRIDARVDAVRDALYSQEPDARDVADKARGILWMPLLTEASFGFGGGYGRGALRINDITVDYYSATRATFGLQIGGQQYSHALFFMTEDALSQFRRSPGWAVGADVRYATPDQGLMLGKETTEIEPVIAMVFGQSGLIAGASVAGIKYSRIIP